MEWMLMPYRRYAEFSGRSRRKEYWMFALFVTIIYLLCAALMLAGGLASAFGGSFPSPDGTAPLTPEFGPLFWVGAILFGLFALASFIPSISVGVRRLHDRNMSGWWYLGFIVGGAIPVIGGLISIGFIVLMALPGTTGSNNFGDDPKNPLGYDVFG